MKHREGFTIVEVLIAIVMLTLGILTLASTAGGITRMMSNGQRKTRAYALASSTMDSLRNKAVQACSGLANGTSTHGEVSRAWTVSSPGSTQTLHTISVTTSYRVSGRTKGDTLYASIYC